MREDRLFPLRFRVALVAGWLILGTAARILAQSRGLPVRLAVPAGLAFLTEYSFYLLPGFAEVRAGLRERWSGPRIAGGMWATGLLPYLVLTVPTGTFDGPRFLALAAILGAVSFWFVGDIADRLRPVRDVLFLALLAVMILSGVLKWVFPALAIGQTSVPMEVLGHITLVRTAFLAVLVVGRRTDVVFGFVPTGREAWIGAGWFVACAAVALPLGWWMGEVKPLGHAPRVWQGIALFFGVLWVLALSEEFFFRALLQGWLAKWTRSRAAGLGIASVIFGACHLGMHRAFPNWRYAILAGLLGLACGAAFLQTRSLRASMITHALTVTALRVFLS